MSKVLVYCEQANGKLKSSSLELLSAAKNSGSVVEAVLLGSASKSLAEEAGKYGASKLYVCDNASLDNYNPQSYAEVLNSLIEAQQPKIVLASGSSSARDLFPTIAAKFDTSYVSDCTHLEINGDDVKVTRPMYSGKCTADVEFINSPIKIVLMRPNQLTIGDNNGATAELVELNAPATDLITIVKEVVKGTSKRLDLTEANIVVSGGRGLKDAGNFKLLENLADVLGASVGASRAVVDAEWVDHSMQVGQTGKTVAPSLYIACGISGAIQHLAGMSSSKVIVAINTDPDAPIFQKATYGIVGDALEILPILTEEFKKIL